MFLLLFIVNIILLLLLFYKIIVIKPRGENVAVLQIFFCFILFPVILNHKSQKIKFVTMIYMIYVTIHRSNYFSDIMAVLKKGFWLEYVEIF